MKKKMTKPPHLVKLIKSGELQRRHIRYMLFQIRLNKDCDPALKSYVESQFEIGQHWSNFTFEWDVGADDPLQVISIEEWVKSGGAFDSIGKRIPSAFTQQK